MVLKNLLRRRVRTALSILGVAIGVGAIIAFHAVGRGFKASIDRYMAQTGAQMVVVNRTVQDPAFSRISKDDQNFIRALPDVEHLSPATFTIASPRGLKLKSKMLIIPVFGRQPGDRLLEKFRGRVKGRIIEKDDEIMLGEWVAQDLELKPGDTLELFGQEFRVVGIHDPDVGFERIGAIMPNAVVQRQLKMGDAITMGFVYLRPGADVKRVKAAVEERSHLEAMRPDEFTMYYNQLEYIDWFVWIISLVSVVVGGLGVLNTMLMSVSERTREIGTLRAVGWSRGRVLRLILLEGAAISVVGGVLGLGVGVAGAESLILGAPRGMDTCYSAALFIEAMVVAVGLGFAGALYPALQASRLSPIEALKYE